MGYDLTKNQIAFFWKRFYFWLEYWGIDKCWQMHERLDTSEETQFYSAIATSHEDGMAVVHLCTNWDVRPTKQELDKVAFHESLHVLLAPLSKDDGTLTAEHAIIRTLENTVWKELS